MGGQYKKQQRAEKAKVKLKGAKLPKGLNVTKTEFKVRKINIREQLKDSQYLDGERQVNLKEILTRLKHHGPTFRLEALRNLREAILIGHASIANQLQDVIQGISAICLDIEREPRRESFNTLSKLLSNLTVEGVAPFFHIISSYLRCAMTHIQPALQEDSLLMLDVLLEHVPQLVAEQSVKIFHDFLQMISKVRADGSDTNRTLTVNMGQKQTTIKWRAKVLQRLQSMLRTQCELKQKHTDGKKSLSYEMRTFNTKTPQHYSLKRTYNTSDVSELFTLSTANAPNALNENDEVLVITTYIEHLMPLLFDAWLEVRPQASSNNSNNSLGAQLLLSNDAALTLKVVLDITECLWCLVDVYETNSNTKELSVWFKKVYAELFATNFLNVTAFPYQQSEHEGASNSSKRSKKSSNNLIDAHCLLQNISLTYLMCRFFDQSINKKSAKYFTVLLEYLQTIVNSLKQHSIDHQRTLVLALRTQLLTNGLAFLQILPDKMYLLLQATITAFLQQQFSNKEQNAVLILLCDIVQNADLAKAYGNNDFNKLLSFLPQLLLKPTITQEALLSMSNLCKQQNRTFLQALAFCVADVIDNIVKIQVQGAVNVFEGKKHIMNLFYWIAQPTNAEELCEKIKANVADKRIVSYFTFILTHC